MAHVPPGQPRKDTNFFTIFLCEKWSIPVCFLSGSEITDRIKFSILKTSV
jgi:hypothetical protein